MYYISGKTLCALSYTDDIVLLANNPQDLQKLLDDLCIWCKKWKLILNQNKSSVVHFRGKRVKRDTYQLKIGQNTIEYTGCYKYLGCILMNIWSITLQQHNLQKVDSSSVMHKYKYYPDICYKTFEKMYSN